MNTPTEGVSMTSTSHANQVEQPRAAPAKPVRVVAGGALLMIAAIAVALSTMGIPASAAIPPPGTSQGLQMEPRYTVKVQWFKALDESHIDALGSDSVFGLFYSTRGYSVRTATYDGVDDGDVVWLEREERCLMPQRILSGGTIHGWLVAPQTRWECDPRGVPAPIGLKLELWENDPCGLGCFNPYVPPVIDPEDDTIGRAEVTYTSGQLASRLPYVGQVWSQQFILGGPCGFQAPNHVCAPGTFDITGPEYKLAISIERVSDAPLFADHDR
jgi:hypothetical protein